MPQKNCDDRCDKETDCKAVHKLNRRPRKCWEFKTSYKVLEELTDIKQSSLIGFALIT